MLKYRLDDQGGQQPPKPPGWKEPKGKKPEDEAEEQEQEVK